jgi:hypothetical protein
MTVRRRSLATCVLVLAVACGNGGSTPSVPTPTSLSAEAAGKPSVEITYPPDDGDPLPRGTVLVALTVRSFGLVDAMGGKPKDGEGHLVYYLDVDPIPSGADATDVPEGAGRAEASAMTSHTWEKVAAGRHTIGVQLVGNDDTPLDPPSTDTVDIVVGG